MAFFGRRKLPDGNVDYCFSGYATVGGKVSQADIWPEDGSRCDYQRYLNLLVKRRGERFSHYEVHPGKPHPDWLWRVTCKDGHSWVKADFGTFEDPDCSKSFTPGTDVAGSGEPIEFAPNYVVFAQGSPETFIIAEPPVVARYHRGSYAAEEWATDTVAASVRALTLEQRPGRTLRIASKGYPRHPHIRIPMKSDEWRGQMSKRLREVGARPLLD